MSVTAIVVGTIVLVLAAIAGIVALIPRRPSDTERRTKQLIEIACQLFPATHLTDSLDKLYERTYKNLVAAKRRGENVSDLIRDQMLIANARLDIWRAETEARLAAAERDSHFKIIPGATPRKPPQPA